MKKIARTLYLANYSKSDPLFGLVEKMNGAATASIVADETGLSIALAGARLGEYVRHNLLKRVYNKTRVTWQVDEQGLQFYRNIIDGKDWKAETVLWLSRNARMKVWQVLVNSIIPLSQVEMINRSADLKASQLSPIIKDMASMGVVTRQTSYPYRACLNAPYREAYFELLKINPGF